MNDDDLLFEHDDEHTEMPATTAGCWKLLIVDDEPEVHQITELALANFTFNNKSIEFLNAYSAAEALEIIKNTPDIALTLLDVVMESDHAGLHLVQKIREEIGNHMIRIVLRTGQPGMAPEHDIIVNYDINDYAEKTELSAQKLFTIVVASLRAYRDITALEESRKQLLASNQHLAEERERIQVTLDSIGDAVLTTDAHSLITHLNPVAEKLTGWNNDDALGLPLVRIFKIINASSRVPVDNPVEKVLLTGKVIGLANHTILIDKQGKEYQIADSAAPIRGEDGRILGVILVFRDITQQYQTETALRRSQKMEAIGQLSGGIAHDFNNQLSIIIGYLDFLSKHVADDEKPRKWVDISTSATLRCMDLTRQLLSFSRTQSSKKLVVDINSKLQELETMFSRSVTPQVEVQYSLADELWLTEIDPGEFQDAILNMVINARDAMPNGGKLHIETSNISIDKNYAALNPDASIGNYVQLVLSDTGSGMDSTTQEHIFEPFYTTKPEGKGTGLGMSMVYGFIKRFDGFIKISSEIDIGTSIHLYLPRATAGEADIETRTIGDTKLPQGNETVLIVDDEVDLLDLTKNYLSELGYKIYMAKNASQALDILSRQNDIDILFCDVLMPGGMDGFELAQQATEDNPELKVLITSGCTSKTVTQTGHSLFSAHILSKPYRKADLAQHIRTVLDK